MTDRLHLETTDGLTLEARIDSPKSPNRFTVFCHPHPLHGGSMHAPLMISVAARLVERGHTVLRFNFRGTGASTGEHGYGKGELEDVSAAMAVADASGLPVGLAGWSFGASVALQWLTANDSSLPYAGIAPAPKLLPVQLSDGPKRIIVGSRDQVVEPDEITAYAVEHGIDLVLTQGDHFFHGRGQRIGDLTGQGLEA